MSEPDPAVFLSYAALDTAAARRLAEALRASGVEVWFDQDELRGGDAWDHKIRRQIRECALFVPIISANTQARTEGYFRLEWHLAEQRSLLMAKGRAFIVPVCVDATRESEAFVPDVFLGVQWSRAASNVELAGLVAQVQRLLTQPIAPSRHSGVDAGSVKIPTPEAPSVPDFELVRLIGRGSYGDVWLARGITGLWRAIKIIWRERFADAGPFEREFKGLKEFAGISLGQSIQLALLHVGRNEAAGFFYYVMELADDAERGRQIEPASYVPLTFSELRVRRGRLPAEECLRFGVELARVLAGLHQRGLVHRDIKPSNVILVEGVPKLADIGLVAPVTSARTFVGTEGYVPPEGPGSPSADVYALGKVLYELATGLDRQEFPQLPPELNRLPDHRALLELNEIILRACDPLPERRHRDGAALLVELSALQAGRSPRRRRIWSGVLRVAAVVTVVAASMAGVRWKYLSRPRPAASPPASPPAATVVSDKSIAVLPFANLSDDKGNEYFSDGISEELLTVLQKIPGLHVAARTSAFYFKGKNATAQEIGEKLGVANLVEGSVQKIGNRVKISARLSRVATGEQLWSENFTRDLADVFAVQSEIAQTIVAQLRGQLTGKAAAAAKAEIQAQVQAAEKGGTRNVEAHELYLQGKFFVNQHTVESAIRAAGLLRRAVELDPQFALAWAALSGAGFARGGIGETKQDFEEGFKLAREAADQALALAPDLAAAQVARANLLIEYDFDWKGAAESLQRARALAPSDPAVLAQTAQLAYALGQAERAVELGRQAVALDPVNPRLREELGFALAGVKRYDEARAEFQRIIELSPSAPWGHGGVSMILTAQGKADEAVAESAKDRFRLSQLYGLALAEWARGNKTAADAALAELIKSGSDVSAAQIAWIYAFRHDNDRAFEWLERAYRQRDAGLAYTKANFALESLHPDPRWPAFWKKMGMTDEQLMPAPPPAAIVVSDKSIAVLPFANRSPDKENEFFTDGVHEDILTNLTNIRELRVVSNTSVGQYRGTTKSMKQIGAELGVAYILEGSVQRVGNKVHVTGQLIDARTDTYLWAKSFDKDLSDVFAIQAELATAIAANLQAVLSPEEKKLVEQKLTQNPEAYDLYLKSRSELDRVGNTRAARERVLTLNQAAVELDPKFAAAWVLIASAHGYIYGQDWDHTPTRLAQAKQALDKVELLAPGSPLAIGASAAFCYTISDYARSLEQYESLARLQPNNSNWQNQIAVCSRRLGRWPLALAAIHKAIDLDPESIVSSGVLVQVADAGRRFGEADAEDQRWLRAHPNAWARTYSMARRAFRASGSMRDAEKILGAVPESYAASTAGIEARKSWAFVTGNLDEYLRLDALKPSDAPADWTAGQTQGVEPALVLMTRGDTAGARARLADVASMRTRLEAEPDNDVLWTQLGEYEALLGNKESALRCAGKAVELLPESRDPFRGPERSLSRAFVYAWTGDKDRAIAEYARLLRVPVSRNSQSVSASGTELNIYEMKHSPTFFPLRGDPRFEALLNDPKNNAPLF